MVLQSIQKIRREVKWIIHLLPILLAGCVGIATPEEREARDNQVGVSGLYRPDGKRPELPKIGENSSLQDYLTFAILNHPEVEAAYYDWVASVDRITRERSPPDPRLTFEADIQDVVMSLMVGLMVDIPGPGKLRARAQVAALESEMEYFKFRENVLKAATETKRAFYEAYFLDQKIKLSRQMLELAVDLEEIASVQNSAGKGTLQDVLRAQIEKERLKVELSNLRDSRHWFISRLKGALGIPEQEDKLTLPRKVAATPQDIPFENMLSRALEQNPKLQQMRIEVDRAQAAYALAGKSRVPDFSIGLEADALADPTIFTPQLGVTLPIWRDKIAAEISESLAKRNAAEARQKNENIQIAVAIAEQAFMYRESNRLLSLIRGRLLKKAKHSLELARTAYSNGKLDFTAVLDAQRTLINLQIEEVNLSAQREIALANLSHTLLGQMPAGAPFTMTKEKP
jgi:outer membrane protein, heavy metal efflux system